VVDFEKLRIKKKKANVIEPGLLSNAHQLMSRVGYHFPPQGAASVFAL